MIGEYWPPAWLALVPVIWIEAWVARRTLRVSWPSAICSTALANLVSTLIGIPMTWVAWMVVEDTTARGMSNPGEGIYAVTAQAPWLIPYEQHLWWMIPAAAVTLTIVFFLVSVAVEWLIMRAVHRRLPSKDVTRWAWRANGLSYAVILLFVIVCLYVPTRALDRVAGKPVDFITSVPFRVRHWLTGSKVATREGRHRWLVYDPKFGEVPCTSNA